VKMAAFVTEGPKMISGLPDFFIKYRYQNWVT
jgi:hypothetical protein